VGGELTGAWVAARYAIEPRVVEAMRREGELIAVWRDGEYHYPAWQFGPTGPLPGIGTVVAAARRRGLDDARLVRLLDEREGLTGQRRLHDALREGHSEPVLAAIRSASI
jgi:hypothetical protein